MTPSLKLETSSGGLATLTFDLPDKKVNVFTREVLAEFDTLLTELSERTDIDVLILVSGKPTNFIAGVDVTEIAAASDPAEVAKGVRLGQALFGRWNRLPCTTVVAIRGTCVGGGTELALASDYILISDRTDIRIGLPEIKLGIVPAWGGCTRLPSRIGLIAALDMILAGKTIDPRRAHRLGLVDALLPDAGFPAQVHRFARMLAAGEKPRRHKPVGRARLIERLPGGRTWILHQARKQVLKKTGGHYPAPLRAIEVVATGRRHGLDAGLEAEVRAAAELAVSPVCKNLMHLFDLMESARRMPASGPAERIHSVGVVGAGVMGGGIAQLVAARASVPVRLKDIGYPPLAKGMAHAARLFDKLVERSRLTPVEAHTRMNLLRPCLGYSGFERIDLVIEAIVENLEVKQAVFAALGEHVRPPAVLASNTSSLPIEQIGLRVADPERVVGMHFFNPVHKMPLVEIVRARSTDTATVATAMEFARRLGKTPIVVRDGPGFLVNRLLGFYMTEALWLFADGHAVDEIDRTMTSWGMPMGPLELIDEVGIDVAVEVARVLHQAFGDRLPLPDWSHRLANEDRLGAKTGHGIYLYEGGVRKRPDPDLRQRLGLPAATVTISSPDLIDRLVLRMVDEAARCLDEGIVPSADQIDLAMILGTGLPPFRGGLCRWADQRGLDVVVGTMRRFENTVGDRFRPSAPLEAAAASGGFYGPAVPH